MSAGGEQRGFMIESVAAAEELIARTQQVKRSLESSPNGAISTADELVKWAQLRDQGVITDEEFAARKAKLLG